MDSSEKKKVLEKFATKLLECTLRVDVKIGKTYKVEVTDDGFTVRKRRQKSADGMHFRYENVTSYQATKEGDQFVLQIEPTSLGSAGGLFRFKTSEAAKIVALASRLSVVAAVRKEAQLSRTASGGSLLASPRSPAKTPGYHSGPLLGASQDFSPSERSAASESVLSSSPDSATSRSTSLPTKGGGSQELSPSPLKANVTPPKWTTTPTPYVAVPNAPPEKKPNPDELMKDALGEALKKELRKSGELKSPYTRKRSSDGGNSQPSSKPPSAGSSKASSPKLTKQASVFSSQESEEGPRVSSRLSETPNLSRQSLTKVNETPNLSRQSSSKVSETPNLSRQSSTKAGETPNLSRQSSAKGVYSRQSSLGSEEGGIRLLPRVASGSNPFLTDALGEDPPSPSRRTSSLPPPPTSPKKGVFEGFEQFVKVAPSSESSRRSSTDVSRRGSDVSRRSSDAIPTNGARFDLLEDPDESCAPPIVVEIMPKRGAILAQPPAPWQGLDAEVAPGTWSLPEVGSEWLEVSPGNSPPGTGRVQATQGPSVGGSDAPGSLTSADPSVLRVAIPQQQPASPAGNPFQSQYPDPFVAAFGLNPVPSPEAVLVRTRSANPFANASHPATSEHAPAPAPGGKPSPFAGAHLDPPWTISSSETNQAVSLSHNSTTEKLSGQKGPFQRSQTQPTHTWQAFPAEAVNPPVTQSKPALTRSITEPPLVHSTPALIDSTLQSWEPFHTGPSYKTPSMEVNSNTGKAASHDTPGDEMPDHWEDFGRQRSLSSRSRPTVL